MKTELFSTGQSIAQNFGRSTFAFSSHEIMQTVTDEISAMRKSGKKGLALIQEGIQRLLKMGAINDADAKKLKELALLLVKVAKGGAQRKSASGKIDQLFRSMILNDNYSDLATVIVNAMRIYEPRSTSTGGAARKASADNGSAAVITIGGALAGAGIGFAIGGGLGMLIGAIAGGVAGAVVESCLD